MLRRVRYPIGPALSRRQVDFPADCLFIESLKLIMAWIESYMRRIPLSMRPTPGESADVQLVRAAPPVTLSTTVMSASARDGEARESATFRSGSFRSWRFHGCDAMPTRALALREISHVLACMRAEILPVCQKSVWLRADGAPSVCVPRGTPKPAACTADRRVASSSTLRPMEAATQPVIAAAARRPKADTVGVTRLIAATP